MKHGKDSFWEWNPHSMGHGFGDIGTSLNLRLIVIFILTKPTIDKIPRAFIPHTTYGIQDYGSTRRFRAVLRAPGKQASRINDVSRV